VPSSAGSLPKQRSPVQLASPDTDHPHCHHHHKKKKKKKKKKEEEEEEEEEKKKKKKKKKKKNIKILKYQNIEIYNTQS
jgi:hypothetical protein